MKNVVLLIAALAFSVQAEESEFKPCRVYGQTAPRTWIVSNTGEITQADKDGNYELTLPVQGFYCLKAMKDGYREMVRPWLLVPTLGPVNFHFWAHQDKAVKVHHGKLDHPAQLLITDSGAPVRGFDVAGTPIGSFPAPKGVWHCKNPYFWTAGEYCFTATGEVKVTETLDFPALRERGWYKGDFHAHIIHYENFYRANLQQMKFICQAEHYDWIWLSGGFSNDDYPVDFVKLAKFLSNDRFCMRVNNEFPKNFYGHFGNVGVDPLAIADYGPGYNEEKVTNLELAEKTVYAKGGISIPVHPLYGDVVRIDKKTGRKRYGMINNELVLWLLCCPERIPVVDFFYFPEVRAEKFWYKLLNKGYTLAVSGSSDAAFDVGVTPGNSHATYAKLDRLAPDAIVEAFKQGRTMVGYHGSGVILEIDGKTSGDRFLPDGKKRKLKADAFCDPGVGFAVEVIRNGEVFARDEFVAPADGHWSVEREISERDTAWYVAVLRTRHGPKPRAVASPIYFRGKDFQPPKTYKLPRPLPERIRERIKYLTPEETDTDEWYEELAGMLDEAQGR